jgi:hypothetical protein
MHNFYPSKSQARVSDLGRKYDHIDKKTLCVHLKCLKIIDIDIMSKLTSLPVMDDVIIINFCETEISFYKCGQVALTLMHNHPIIVIDN